MAAVVGAPQTCRERFRERDRQGGEAPGFAFPAALAVEHRHRWHPSELAADVLDGVVWIGGAHDVTRLAFLIVALLEVACGGQVVPGGADAEPDVPGRGGGRDASLDSPAGDAGADRGTDAPPPPWSPVCPHDQPTSGSACTREGLDCEYGKIQYDVGCDTVLICMDGEWMRDDAYVPFGCVPDGPTAAGCPPSPKDLSTTDAGDCSGDASWCAYPQAVCQCLPGLESSYWGCNPGGSCPMPRPRLGAACSAPGENCTYLGTEYIQICQGGYWQAEICTATFH
jgi:hypothetical protein